MEIYSKFILIIIIQNIFLFNKVLLDKPILLVIAYDGFRNDYLDRGITPTLSNFRANGVHSEFLKTVYPPVAYPAFHSIATGLYPENHGLKGRPNFYNDVDEEFFNIFKPNETTPIWLLNQMNGGTSLCIMWPDGDAEYSSTEVSEKTCSIPVKYNYKETLKKRADRIIDNLKSNPSINLVMFYVEQLDRITHFFGPLSRNSTLFIRRLDLLTKYIIKKLIEIKVYHRTNIFIISDHGMISVNKDKVIEPTPFFYFPGTKFNLKDDAYARATFDLDFTRVNEYISTTDNFTNIGRQGNQYEIVRMPPGYNITYGLLEYAACPGFIFGLFSKHVEKFYDYYNKKLGKPKTKFKFVGIHGYLRQNDALFMAKGPLLARFKKVEPFEMVDLYSAFTRILNIHGDYERDGNYSRILPIFPEHKPMEWIPILVTIFALAFVFTFVFHHIVQYLLETETYES